MKLIAQCELCKLVHHVDIELEGKTIKCRQCSVPVKVPDLLDSSPELPTPSLPSASAPERPALKKSRSSRRARGKLGRPSSRKTAPVSEEPSAPRSANAPTDSEIERRVDSAFLDLVDTLASGRREPSQPPDAGIPSLEDEPPEAPVWGAPQAMRPEGKSSAPKSRLGRRKPGAVARARGLRKAGARKPIKVDSEPAKKRGGPSDFKRVREGMDKIEVLEIMGEPEGVHPQDDKRMTISYPAPDRPGSRKRGQLFTIAFLGDRVIAKNKMSRADAEAFFKM